MALYDMRDWLASVRKSKLSTRVTVLFAAALVIPWFAYAGLTISQHEEHVERTERHLAALAAAYGQHAATLIQLRAQGADVSRIGVPMWTARVEKDLAGFREALNVPNVTFTLRRPGSARSQDGMIVGEANDPATGIDIVASMSRSEAIGATAPLRRRSRSSSAHSSSSAWAGFWCGNCAGAKRWSASSCTRRTKRKPPAAPNPNSSPI